MNKELIEKLKQNLKPFGFNTKEEQRVFYRVGYDNCECYCQQSVNPVQWSKVYAFAAEFTYRIKPDYQSEPEYVDLEIVKRISTIGCSAFALLGCEYAGIFIPLHYLLSLPNFVCFKYAEGTARISIKYVAGLVYEGKKVYARMRRGNAQKADN